MIKEIRLIFCIDDNHDVDIIVIWHFETMCHEQVRKKIHIFIHKTKLYKKHYPTYHTQKHPLKHKQNRNIQTTPNQQIEYNEPPNTNTYKKN